MWASLGQCVRGLTCLRRAPLNPFAALAGRLLGRGGELLCVLGASGARARSATPTMPRRCAGAGRARRPPNADASGGTPSQLDTSLFCELKSLPDSWPGISRKGSLGCLELLPSPGRGSRQLASVPRVDSPGPPQGFTSGRFRAECAHTDCDPASAHEPPPGRHAAGPRRRAWPRVTRWVVCADGAFPFFYRALSRAGGRRGRLAPLRRPLGARRRAAPARRRSLFPPSFGGGGK